MGNSRNVVSDDNEGYQQPSTKIIPPPSAKVQYLSQCHPPRNPRVVNENPRTTAITSPIFFRASTQQADE